jgi:predicted nucleotidyltransferase
MIKKDVVTTLVKMSEHPNVELIYLFGSVTQLNDYDDISVCNDIDFSVYMSNENEIFHTLSELQTHFLSNFPKEYDLISLNTIPLQYKIQIIRGECIFHRSLDLKDRIETTIEKEWAQKGKEILEAKKRNFESLLGRYRGGWRDNQKSIRKAR